MCCMNKITYQIQIATTGFPILRLDPAISACPREPFIHIYIYIYMYVYIQIGCNVKLWFGKRWKQLLFRWTRCLQPPSQPASCICVSLKMIQKITNCTNNMPHYDFLISRSPRGIVTKRTCCQLYKKNTSFMWAPKPPHLIGTVWPTLILLKRLSGNLCARGKPSTQISARLTRRDGGPRPSQTSTTRNGMGTIGPTANKPNRVPRLCNFENAMVDLGADTGPKRNFDMPKAVGMPPRNAATIATMSNNNQDKNDAHKTPTHKWPTAAVRPRRRGNPTMRRQKKNKPRKREPRSERGPPTQVTSRPS